MSGELPFVRGDDHGLRLQILPTPRLQTLLLTVADAKALALLLELHPPLVDNELPVVQDRQQRPTLREHETGLEPPPLVERPIVHPPPQIVAQHEIIGQFVSEDGNAAAH